MTTRPHLFAVLIGLMTALMAALAPSPLQAQDESRYTSVAAIFGSKGVLTLDIVPEHRDTVRWVLHNDDGTPYATIDLPNAHLILEGDTVDLYELEGLKLAEKHGFRPKIFEPDYSLFQFEVASLNEQYYEVYVDKSAGTTKRVVRESAWVTFEPWLEHMTGTAVILDDSAKIYSRPDAAAELIHTEPCAYYTIESVRGEWALLSCKGKCSLGERVGKMIGWVQWHRDGDVAVSLRYTC